jgi:hypothetical protein
MAIVLYGGRAIAVELDFGPTGKRSVRRRRIGSINLALTAPRALPQDYNDGLFGDGRVSFTYHYGAGVIQHRCSS